MNLHFPLFTSGHTKDFGYREMFWNLVDSSFSELHVISPFIDSKIFDLIFRKTLSQNTGRSLILISRPPDNVMRKEDFKIILDTLESNRTRYRIGNGNTVKWYFDSSLHAKALVADFDRVIFGSQNITYNGLGDDLNKSKCNDELGAYFSDLDENTAMRLRAYVDILVRNSNVAFPRV